jgi:cobalt/nickel transport system permease protein
MHPATIERHTTLGSPIHRLPPAVKVAGAIMLVAGIAILPLSQARWLAVPAGLLVALLPLSRLPLRFVLRRLLLLEPLVIGVSCMALFQDDGGRRFAFLVTKTTLCLLTMIILAGTTPFSAMLRVLRNAHVPSLLITTLALMYRYLFVLTDEATRMRRARAARTFAPTHSRRWRLSASVIAQLFLRAAGRAQRIYLAMCARGWT